ncbi:hypothetical protein FEE95_16230 [Maribacter algarum]|uniref:MG2 domain-containing protein n=1 Tax=Maribacter algarum (ex Zhang et al. 2020) TaxID=2578118 RepID=A0A5S3PP78_9FLAO|nr:hypothetical protein [Maribacter algarum]TMM56171.1 hypothetical protein FEE95_16230 [Maribacter algarum]
MKLTWVALLFFFSFAVAAQQSLSENFRVLNKSSILKEKVFIHTNKTSYFQDDTIWFKAYVADTINHPSIQTTKLYVNLLDHQGLAIYSKTVLIEEGIGLGQFELNNAVGEGVYYIQGYTNYMRNFGDDYYYIQKIQVLKDNSKQSIAPIENQYDIQILPEGGYLLEGIENRIGIKALLNGFGCDYEGQIRNKLRKTIASFKSQHLGMTRCTFQYREDEKYYAEVVFKDTILTIEIPVAKRKGIALHLENIENNYVEVYLKTNERTLNSKDLSNYSLLFRQDDRVSDLFSLTRFDSLTGRIQMKKDLFFDGVNTVTLFKEKKPIAERKFFVELKEKRTDVLITPISQENDSLAYKLNLRGGRELPKANLSISIFSPNSLRNEEQNIKTAFLLTPFLKGYIEKPSYYFNSENKKRKEHLDLLLLTQGWTQYSLPEKISKLKSKPLYKFEYGFDLRGKIESSVKYDSIALIRDNFQIIDKVALKNDLSFNFNNLLLFKKDTTKLAFIDNAGKIIKPGRIKYDSLEKPKIPLEKKHPNVKNNTLVKPKELNPSPDIPETIIPSNGTIVLDEAIITEKKRSESYLRRRKLIEKYKPLVRDIGKYREVRIREVFQNYEHDLISFLQANGARLNETNPLDPYLEAPNKKEALLLIDGRLFYPDELTSLSLSMKNVAHVMVTDSPTMIEGKLEGRLYGTTVYQVFTTKGYQKNIEELFDKFVIENGYDHPKKYYTPLNEIHQSRFPNMFEVDWKPSIKIDDKGEVDFKIPKKYKNRKLIFSIQGFSEKGHLISETISIE